MTFRLRTGAARLVGMFVASAIVMLIQPAAGQTVTGSLFGVATDEGNARLPGVTVTVASPQLITGQDATVTTAEGTYRFAALPAGTYTVTFELPGFQAVKRENVTLLSGQSLAVDGQLRIAAVQETITVTGAAPLVDTRSSALVNTATAATLENIPTAREFTKILNIMPGVTDSRYVFAPINVVNGSSPRQNAYNLDGLGTTDQTQGVTSMQLPVDALQEVQITTAGISAEYGDASGAVFNFVSKSGGNQFHGGSNIYYQGKSTRANNLDDALKAQGLLSTAGTDKQTDWGGFLGGPIVTNKAWFFANVRRVDQTDAKPDFAGPIDYKDIQLFSKATAQLARPHKVELSYFVRNYRNFPYTENADFRSSGDPRTWGGQQRDNYILNPGWNWVVNSNTLLEVRASRAVYSILGFNPNVTGAPVYTDQTTGVLSGGVNQGEGLNYRNRHQFKSDLSHFQEGWLGSHSFKGGFLWQYAPVYEDRWRRTADGSEDTSPLADVQHILLSGVPFRVAIGNQPAVTRYDIRKVAAYVQDQWVISRVTFNVGARFDRVTGDIGQGYTGGGRFDPRIDFPAQDDVMRVSNWAPRFGIAWDVTGDHKTTVRASGGKFYSEVSTFITKAVDPEVPGVRTYDWVDRNGDRVYQVGEETLLRTDTRINLSRLPIVDPNLKNQYTNVYTLGLERQLWNDWAMSVTGIVKRDADFLGQLSANIPLSVYRAITVPNPLNGTPLTVYTLPSQYLGLPNQPFITNPTKANGDLIEDLSRKYNGAEFVLRRPFKDGWQLQASYVYGHGFGNANNTYRYTDVFDGTNPNFLVNANGEHTLGSKHQFKLNGTVQVPLGIVVSGSFEALSGTPWNDGYGLITRSVKGARSVRLFRTTYPQILSETFIDVAAEAPGSQTLDTTKRLDLRAEKKFRIRAASSVSLVGDLFNVLNDNTVISLKDLRTDSPNFALPLSIVSPRQLRVGLKFDF